MIGKVLQIGLAVLAGAGILTLIIITVLLCYYTVALTVRKIRESLRGRR